MKCRDRILGKVLNDDVAKVVMMFVGLWLLGTLMSHAQIEIWASGLRVVFDLCTLVLFGGTIVLLPEHKGAFTLAQ